MDAHDHAKGGVAALQLLAQDAQADVIHARSAVRLGDGRAQEPEFAHPVEDFTMDLALLVPGSDVRRDLGRHEVAHGLLDEDVLRGERGIDGHRQASGDSD